VAIVPVTHQSRLFRRRPTSSFRAMSAPSLKRLLATTATLAGTGAVAIGTAAAPAETGHAAAKRITPAGVDGVKIGKTYRRLREQGLVGRLRRGCELGGPNTRSARLRAPLAGQVNFTLKAPRRVTDISIRGGARARGVGIGAKIPAIKAAFPKAKVDHSTDTVFRLTLVRVPKRGGGRLMFGVSTKSKRVTVIGVPFIAFCE
jgi:hypothetical protein